VAAGAKVFQGLGCTSCHTAEMKTGSGHPLAELRNQTIKPYTDLLLHDMGPGLADSYVRRPGRRQPVAHLAAVGHRLHRPCDGHGGKVGYLHDGRARTLTEAVMWHGGEGETCAPALHRAVCRGSTGRAGLPAVALIG
jgi:CxxC motif-containing protein (DUF1111 family)